jgi:hypothetical protein
MPFSEMSVKVFVAVVLLLALAGGAFYFVYMMTPGAPISLRVLPNNLTNSNPLPYTTSTQFYPNMRFSSSEISYAFADACSDDKEANVAAALSILQDQTVLSFREISASQAEITILCSEIGPEPEQRGHFIAGEGGPTEIINTTRYSVIQKGKLSLYREENCERPMIALHELLHVLGFDHNNDPRSIMFPTLDCDQELDDYITEAIDEIYSEPSLPDLAIVRANATKEGRYVSFAVEVMNKGLVEVDNVKLEVREGDDVLKTFELQTMNIGVRKTLTVDNLRASREGSEIQLRVVSNSPELDENNNYLNLGAN